jgi:hypothetical protein
MPPGAPKLPPGALPLGPPPTVNPLVENFSADQKKMLKDIHAKYGVVGKSPLAYAVAEGEGEQTFDIKLK